MRCYFLLLGIILATAARSAYSQETARSLLDRTALEQWQADLNSEKVVVRWLAVATINKEGLLDRALVPLLIARLDDPYSPIRTHALEALEQMGPDAAEAALVLVDNLNQGRSSPQVRVVRALGQIGAGQNAVVKALEKCLQDQSALVRLTAAESLWYLQRRPECLSTVAAFAQGEIRGCSGYQIKLVAQRVTNDASLHYPALDIAAPDAADNVSDDLMSIRRFAESAR